MTNSTPDPQVPSAYNPPPSGPSGAAAYPVPSYPAGDADGHRAKGARTLGLVAFIAALAAVVIGSILTYIGGLQLGPVAQYAPSSGDTSGIDPAALPPEVQSQAALGGFLIFAGFAAMIVLALWGFIQGIIAAVKNRGRGWGIAAIIVAVLAFLPVSIFLGIGTAAGVASSLS